MPDKPRLPLAMSHRPAKEAVYENVSLRHPGGQADHAPDSLPSLPARRFVPSRQASVSSSEGSVSSGSPAKTASSVTSSSATSSKKSSYDEMSINAGRPVIVADLGEDGDSLTAVAFGSPFSEFAHPVPAPRSLRSSKPNPEEEDEVIYEELVPKEDRCDGVIARMRPEVPPRNKFGDSVVRDAVEAKGDNLYCELDSNANASRTSVISHDSKENKNLLEDSEDEKEDKVDELVGKRPLLNPKLTTIDIRQDVNNLWERAVKELDLDESLVEYIEQHELEDERRRSEERRKKSRHSSYDSVAIPELRFKIVNGVQVPIPITLLKNFDPYFDKFDETDEEETTCSKSSSRRDSSTSESSFSAAELRSSCIVRTDPLKHDHDEAVRRGENVYVTARAVAARDSTTSSSSSADLPPPSETPPPAPRTASPSETLSNRIRIPGTSPTVITPRSYENVWIPEDGLPQIEPTYSKSSPPSKPSRSAVRKPFETSFSVPVDGACALPELVQTEMSKIESFSSASEKDCGVKIGSPSPPLYLRNVQRSASASNLSFIAKKFSFTKFSRKFSDQVIKREESLDEQAAEASSPEASSRRSSGYVVESCSRPGTVNHSGPLFVFSKSKKGQVQEKWCVLGNANLRYFNRNDSLAEPKELILLKDVLSLNKRVENSSVGSEQSESLHCFDVAFLATQEKSSRGKLCIRTFGALTASVRDGWVEKVSQSLSYQLACFYIDECSKLGWAHLKVMFAGEWCVSWIALQGKTVFYTLRVDEGPESVDLKKAKNLTLVRDVKNLNAPESVPVLVVDFIDRSLYIQARHEKESLHWKDAIEEIAFNNGGSLAEQQLTRDEIPVVVEQCVNFVFRHGCLTEGIYRHSGVKTKIDRLLTEFRRNAWAVAMTREEFSEHDVANALKRFMRTLDEPLLTRRLRQAWMAASKLTDRLERMTRYAQLLSGLPEINARTLRRLIGHLRTIANQCDRNLMPNYNLAAIWGPTLLTVDGQEATDFAQTSGEADVCRDLIDNFRALFNVTDEEMEREEEIMKKTENFNKNPNPVKISGEVMMFVHIDTKSCGDCVSLAVTPRMTAHELRKRVLRKANYKGDSSRFVLHEVILGGEMERPLHYSELIYDVTLKWWQWSEEDRRETYLLLKRNTFWEEALPCSMPPLSVFGETMYSDNAKGSKGLFKKYHLSMNNAKITRSKEQKSGLAVELDSWDIEKIIWYFGCESKRSPPSNLNITFIAKDVPVERTKEKPYFGRTISFTNRELFIKWVAAMIVAEHQNDIIPPETLLNIDDD